MTPRFLEDGEFDALIAARCVLKDPRRYAAGVLDGVPLDDLQRQAVLAELRTMAELAVAALPIGDMDRQAILIAYLSAVGKLPAVPAGR